ncbi:MAG: O-methyltransferase [Bacteroidota bacterium]
MEFIDEKLAAYAEQYTEPESALLQELNRETWAKVLMPRMLSGHMQGRILSMFARMLQPKRILEIGTYTGYSALCLTEGLSTDGKLYTIDINDELEPMTKRYFAQSPYHSQIIAMLGNAVELVPTLHETFDLVFIDADKENYATYFDLVLDKLRPGGIIIADNVLWSGNVLKPEGEMDEETMALHRFNQKVSADPRCKTVLMPVRDGLMVIMKQ